jgi:hypothetical protein
VVVRCVSGVCAPRAWCLPETFDTENEKRRAKSAIFQKFSEFAQPDLKRSREKTLSETFLAFFFFF